MDKIICSECGTENESEYVYCKNCGAVLKAEEYNRQSTNYNTDSGNPYAERQFDAAKMIDNIDSVPVNDIVDFVGVKATKIIPKFAKMQIQNSKISWCWPVAILSFFFGPFGAAIWFLYRKMNKAAFLFVLLGAVTTASVLFINGKNIGVFENITSVLPGAANNANEFKILLGDYINNAVSLITAILCGLFSMNYYKKFAVRKICEYHNRNTDPKYYRMGLSIIGGTSGGMAVLGVVIFFAVQIALNYLISLI